MSDLYSRDEIEMAMLKVDERAGRLDTPVSAAAWRQMVIDELAGIDDDTVTVDRFTFTDGSEIIIKVKGLNVEAQDAAGRAYRDYLYIPLMNLEAEQDRRRNQIDTDPPEWLADYQQRKEQARAYLAAYTPIEDSGDDE